MAIDIENYRGQLIQYDEDYDKFICDISIEDKYKTSKRGSLKDMRKEIDAFIKLNIEFKPFKAFFKSTYGETDFSIAEVKGIRTDGKFLVSKGYRDEHLSLNDMRLCMEYDHDIFKEKEAANKELENATKLNRIKLKELYKRLKPMDLSTYGNIAEKKVESLT